jgi:hypothetical protein
VEFIFKQRQRFQALRRVSRAGCRLQNGAGNSETVAERAFRIQHPAAQLAEAFLGIAAGRVTVIQPDFPRLAAAVLFAV